MIVNLFDFNASGVRMRAGASHAFRQPGMITISSEKPAISGRAVIRLALPSQNGPLRHKKGT